MLKSARCKLAPDTGEHDVAQAIHIFAIHLQLAKLDNSQNDVIAKSIVSFSHFFLHD
jgi:hypothetical protein